MPKDSDLAVFDDEARKIYSMILSNSLRSGYMMRQTRTLEEARSWSEASIREGIDTASAVLSGGLSGLTTRISSLRPDVLARSVPVQLYNHLQSAGSQLVTRGVEAAIGHFASSTSLSAVTSVLSLATSATIPLGAVGAVASIFFPQVSQILGGGLFGGGGDHEALEGLRKDIEKGFAEIKHELAIIQKSIHVLGKQISELEGTIIALFDEDKKGKIRLNFEIADAAYRQYLTNMVAGKEKMALLDKTYEHLNICIYLLYEFLNGSKFFERRLKIKMLPVLFNAASLLFVVQKQVYSYNKSRGVASDYFTNMTPIVERIEKAATSMIFIEGHLENERKVAYGSQSWFTGDPDRESSYIKHFAMLLLAEDYDFFAMRLIASSVRPIQLSRYSKARSVADIHGSIYFLVQSGAHDLYFRLIVQWVRWIKRYKEGECLHHYMNEIELVANHIFPKKLLVLAKAIVDGEPSAIVSDMRDADDTVLKKHGTRKRLSLTTGSFWETDKRDSQSVYPYMSAYEEAGTDKKDGSCRSWHFDFFDAQVSDQGFKISSKDTSRLKGSDRVYLTMHQYYTKDARSAGGVPDTRDELSNYVHTRVRNGSEGIWSLVPHVTTEVRSNVPTKDIRYSCDSFSLVFLGEENHKDPAGYSGGSLHFHDYYGDGTMDRRDCVSTRLHVRKPSDHHGAGKFFNIIPRSLEKVWDDIPSKSEWVTTFRR